MKERILEVAWELFHEKGYENTTVDEIIQICGISKGGFYHYFRAKDDLLGHYLSHLFDREYEALSEKVDDSLNAKEKLLFYTENLFRYIEDNVPSDVLALAFSTQITKNGEKDLLDERRDYFLILTDIVSGGQECGELETERTTREFVKLYAMQERAILYDWCLCEGQYPLATYGMSLFKIFISSLLGSDKMESLNL